MNFACSCSKQFEEDFLMNRNLKKLYCCYQMDARAMGSFSKNDRFILYHVPMSLRPKTRKVSGRGSASRRARRWRPTSARSRASSSPRCRCCRSSRRALAREHPPLVTQAGAAEKQENKRSLLKTILPQGRWAPNNLQRMNGTHYGWLLDFFVKKSYGIESDMLSIVAQEKRAFCSEARCASERMRRGGLR